MIKCSPTVMRDNLKIVEELKLAGIDFVPVPVAGAEHKADVVKLARANLDIMLAALK